ncbi:uncharacterized protein LOC128676525 [Plodia interpunctella]|uniref:uncharacterized protein LOC128676525 n=1 Tax=Plodia interpunctella TaxID=58824 RepID=UPI002367C631|nr:uncharacterized protein LOC128676525 [Plodia interpunctella]
MAEQARISISEYLSKDILDEDYLKGYSYFWRMEFVLGTCRVDARQRFVTTPTIFQKIYSLAIITFVVFGYYQIVQYNNRTNISRHDEIYLKIFLLGGVLYYSVLVVHSRFMRNRQNAEFHVKLSHCDRHLRSNYRDAAYYLIRANNLRVMTVLLVFLCPLLLLSLTRDITLMIGAIAVIISQTTALVESVHCTSIMRSFTLRMRLVYYIIMYHLKFIQNYVNLKEEPFIMEDRILKKLGSIKHTDFIEISLDVYLKDIFAAFSRYQDNYRFEILVFRSKCIIAVVTVFRMVLFSFQNKMQDFSGLIVMVTLVSLEIFGIFFFYAELFQWEVSRVKVSTVNVMSFYPSGPLRDKAKNIFDLIENSPPNFSVYGIWQMRAYTFISLLSTITWFLITVLQFEFL